MTLMELKSPAKRHPIVLIGAGGIVRDAHLPAYRKAGFTVSGVFDPNRERALTLAWAFGIPSVPANLSDAVATAPPDAVFDIATPASAFLDVLKQLPDGCAVLIQKPMGESLSEARNILDLSRTKKLKAAVNFQLRYAPAIRAARQLIAEGRIGQLHDMEVRVTVYTPWHLWTFLEGIPRVEILYHSVHYLDLLRSFLGNPIGVYAKTVRNPKMTMLASTRSNIILDYGDVTRANVETNHGHEYGLRHQESYVKWEGTGGAIKARLGLLMDYPKGVPDDPELAAYADPQSWFERRDQIKGILALHLKSHGTYHWLGILEPADIWCSDVLTWARLTEHAGFKALDMLQEVGCRDGSALVTTRCPIRIDGEIYKTPNGAPRVGQHTDDIVNEIGLRACDEGRTN